MVLSLTYEEARKVGLCGSVFASRGSLGELYDLVDEEVGVNRGTDGRRFIVVARGTAGFAADDNASEL